MEGKGLTEVFVLSSLFWYIIDQGSHSMDSDSLPVTNHTKLLIHSLLGNSFFHERPKGEVFENLTSFFPFSCEIREPMALWNFQIEFRVYLSGNELFPFLVFSFFSRYQDIPILRLQVIIRVRTTNFSRYSEELPKLLNFSMLSRLHRRSILL